MKAYAIFDGGGVLGAALAGCHAASEEQGIEFVGFGGTSAGSIVALLGAVGFNAKEMESFLVGTDFNDFLEAKGEKVLKLRDDVESIKAALVSGSWYQKLLALPRLKKLIDGLSEKLGIDDGETLKQALLQKVREKNPHFQNHANLTFKDLDEAGCKALKIVASDVSRRVPVVFSLESTGYGNSVLDAVRASTCYPFVFQPFNMNGRRLVDGGLASNLPAFLFHQEYQQTGFPVFAFDLTTEEGPPPKGLSLQDYLMDMVSTALDAGDELMRDVLHDVVHVPVPIPKRFGVLDFEMSREKRRELFNIGYRVATERLSKLEFLRIVKSAGDVLQKRLQSRYGSPLIYEPVLASLARDVESTTAAEKVRAHIMLPTGRDTRIVVYSYGMGPTASTQTQGRVQYASDHDLEIPENAGCSGWAWMKRSPVAADLTEASRNQGWRMTREQHAKIPRDRKSMLSLPIRSDSGDDGHDEDLPVVGTLSIDSSTPLADTLWMKDGALDSELLTRVMLWENVVRRLLRKRHP